MPDGTLIDSFELQAVRAGGPGGQHVNKVSSAVRLRFDIAASPLPEAIQQRLLSAADRRISRSGVLVLKVDEARSQHRNKELAIERLAGILADAYHVPRQRIATRVPKAQKQRRISDKRSRSDVKAGRRKPSAED